MRVQRFLLILVCLIGAGWMTGCSLPELFEPPLATPLPTEYIPTVIAMTLQAKSAERTSAALYTEAASKLSPAAGQSTPTTESAVAPTPTNEPPAAVPTETPTLPSPTATLTEYGTEHRTPWPTYTLPPPTLPPTVTATLTPFPVIPDARVQIYKLGDLSKIVSPLVVTSRLTSRVGKVVRFDLHGEDGRLLARQLRVFYDIPWHVATLTMSLEFEISAAAEVGRLVISVEDVFGRIVDVNSVNLVLLSMGSTELNPASGLLESIIVQSPEPKTLLIGGKVYVSGIAKPFSDQPLNVQLIAEDGRILGHRLAGVTILQPGGYGVFFAEVSYSVTEVTNALLVVYESGEPVSQYAHLTSREVILAP